MWTTTAFCYHSSQRKQWAGKVACEKMMDPNADQGFAGIPRMEEGQLPDQIVNSFFPGIDLAIKSIVGTSSQELSEKTFHFILINNLPDDTRAENNKWVSFEDALLGVLQAVSDDILLRLDSIIYDWHELVIKLGLKTTALLNLVPHSNDLRYEPNGEAEILLERPSENQK